MSGYVQLNPEQQSAVDHFQGPLMVLAGAGTGKTRVLVHRIARLIERGVRPYRILAVTFTNKAAGEMRERIVELIGPSASDMWIGTFHSVCARLLRVHHQDAQLSKNFAIFDTDDQQKLVTRLIKETGLKGEVTARSILSVIDSAKNRGEDPIESAPFYIRPALETIFPMYSDTLRHEDALDFNDLLLRVRDLFDDSDAAAKLKARFEYILVDEFQDTNLVQYDLVRKLILPEQNMTVVGDDDQAIYSWRGAEPRNLLEFDHDYPEAKVVKLEQNYRSTELILEAANSVIGSNRSRHPKELWTERGEGHVLLWEQADTERDEAEFIARAIEGLVEEDGRDIGDCAVLYRTHAQSRVLEEMFRRYRIDYKIVGGVSFFQRREIKDVRAYLRLALNANADSAMERIVNVPTRGIGKTSLTRLREFARQTDSSLLDAARAVAKGDAPSIKAAARRKIAIFVDIMDHISGVIDAGASVAEIIIQVAERSGFRKALENDEAMDAKTRLENISELVSMGSEFDDETDGAGSLVEFDERIALSSTADKEDGRGSAVTMMTVHAAKGLEFPVVFVSGMEDGLFPSIRDRDGETDDRQAMEEERRLAYVAFTRAEERLILSSSRMRRNWSELKVSMPSRFIYDIPDHCLAVREDSKQAQRALSKPVEVNRLRRQEPVQRYDEFDQRTGYDDEDVFVDPIVNNVNKPRPGHMVTHASFGRGHVIEARGEGDDCKVLVDFHSVGLKTILARFVQSAG